MEDNNKSKTYLVQLSFYGYNHGIIPMNADSEEEAKKFVFEQLASSAKPAINVEILSIREMPRIDDEEMLADALDDEVQNVTQSKVIN